MTPEAKRYEENVLRVLEHRLPEHATECDQAWTSGACLRCDVLAHIQVAFGFSRDLPSQPSRPYMAWKKEKVKRGDSDL